MFQKAWVFFFKLYSFGIASRNNINKMHNPLFFQVKIAVQKVGIVYRFTNKIINIVKMHINHLKLHFLKQFFN